jgi:hypothetical protein
MTRMVLRARLAGGLAAALGAFVLGGCKDAAPDHAVAQPDPVISAPSASPEPAAPVTVAPPPAAPTGAPSTTLAANPANAKAPAGTLVVKRLVLAHGVKDREPVDAGASFKGAGHKVYAFVEVENHGREESEVLVEFQPPGGGAPHADITLAVGAAPRWRTWAYTRSATTPGTWTATVKGRRGEVLARTTFEVEP